MGIVCGTDKKNKKRQKGKEPNPLEKSEKNQKVNTNNIITSKEKDEKENELQPNKTIKIKSLEKFIFFNEINLDEEFFIFSNFENLKCFSLIKKYYNKWEEILNFTRPQRKFSYRNLNKNPDFSINRSQSQIQNQNKNKEKEQKLTKENNTNNNNNNNNSEENSNTNKTLNNFCHKTEFENQEISDLIEKFQISFNFNKYRYIKYLSKGPPNNLRWIIWISLALSQSENDFIKKDHYNELVKKIDNNFIRYEEEQIKKDLNRSNPFSKFLQKEKNLNSLYNILKALALEDPELGYCQGMNILAANFLLISDGNEFETFNLLRFLFKHLELREFFLNGFPKLIMYIFILNEFIKNNMPKLFSKIIELDIPEETWIFKWLQTLYNLTLPLSITIRLLDCIICFGLEFLLNFSLAFIKFFEKKLLECNDINDFLNVFNINDIINPEILYQNSNNSNSSETNNSNINDEKEKENINKEINKTNNSSSNNNNNKIYLVNKKDELIIFREKLIKNAKKIDLKDSIKKIIENYNKESNNIEIKNKFKENESSTGDGLQENEQENEEKFNENNNNDNPSKNKTFKSEKNNEKIFNFNKIESSMKDYDSINSIINLNLSNKTPSPIENDNDKENSMRNTSLRNLFNNNNNKKFGDWKLKENEIKIKRKKSFDPLDKKDMENKENYFLHSVIEFYDNENENDNEVNFNNENNDNNNDSLCNYSVESYNYISKKDEISNKIKDIEIEKFKNDNEENDTNNMYNNDNNNMFRIFPNSPNKEQGNFNSPSALKNQSNLRLSTLSSMDLENNSNRKKTNKIGGTFTCRNGKSNAPELDSNFLNNKLNTNKHISRMSFFNNDFNVFFSVNFENLKNNNNKINLQKLNSLNTPKNNNKYSNTKVEDHFNKIKNKLEMIEDINNYDREENEEFEENFEQIELEKRSIIERNISETGINLTKKSFFMSPSPTSPSPNSNKENDLNINDNIINDNKEFYLLSNFSPEKINKKKSDNLNNNDNKINKKVDEFELDKPISYIDKEIDSIYGDYKEIDNNNNNNNKEISIININENLKDLENENKINNYDIESNFDSNIIIPNDDNDNLEMKKFPREFKRNDFFSKSFIHKRKDDLHIKMGLGLISEEENPKNIQKEINKANKNSNNKSTKTKETYNSDILNNSCYDFDFKNFKNCEILKENLEKKSSNNLIKVQINNKISISHNSDENNNNINNLSNKIFEKIQTIKK